MYFRWGGRAIMNMTLTIKYHFGKWNRRKKYTSAHS